MIVKFIVRTITLAFIGFVVMCGLTYVSAHQFDAGSGITPQTQCHKGDKCYNEELHEQNVAYLK
jgi:hypothetical protein